MNMTWLNRAFAGSSLLVGALLVGVAGCGNNNGGNCSPACSSLEACCGTACVNTQADSQNCGGCGIACTAGQECTAGACRAVSSGDSGVTRDAGMRDAGMMCATVCGSNARCCHGECVLNSGGIGSDPFENCGNNCSPCNEMTANSCGVMGGGSGTPVCLCGDAPACTSGVCAQGADLQFRCINTLTDPMNCGSVGNACMTGESCTGGQCSCGVSGRCSTEAGANVVCLNSMCVDLDTDEANCGSPGRQCANSETCTAGSCLCGGEVCDPLTETSLGETCCAGACIANSGTSCTCIDCGPGLSCIRPDTGGFGGGGFGGDGGIGGGGDGSIFGGGEGGLFPGGETRALCCGMSDGDDCDDPRPYPDAGPSPVDASFAPDAHVDSDAATDNDAHVDTDAAIESDAHVDMDAASDDAASPPA